VGGGIRRTSANAHDVRVPSWLSTGNQRQLIEFIGDNQMSIDNMLANVAVKDLQAAVAWYEQLLGRPADSTPMPEVANGSFREAAGYKYINCRNARGVDRSRWL
jgi:hypothetical protein